jgi:hypothetical protein
MLFAIERSKIENFNPDSLHIMDQKGRLTYLLSDGVPEYVIEPRSVGFGTELFWLIRDEGRVLWRSDILKLQ